MIYRQKSRFISNDTLEYINFLLITFYQNVFCQILKDFKFINFYHKCYKTASIFKQTNPNKQSLFDNIYNEIKSGFHFVWMKRKYLSLICKELKSNAHKIYILKKYIFLILYTYVVTYRVTGDGAIILLYGKLVKSCH